ncbi:MAG: hypothetical protein R3E91_00250 [Chlamydiales bacterium]
MTLTSISYQEDKKDLLDKHKDLLDKHIAFRKTSKQTGCSIATASLLVISALIVIVSSSLCFYLPGVNVLHDIVLRGFLPGSIGILLSIPLIIYSIKKAKKKNEEKKELVRLIFNKFEDYKIAFRKKEEWLPFITEIIFKKEWAKEYKTKLLSEMETTYKCAKEQNKNNVTHSKQIDQTLEMLKEAKIEIMKKK